MVITVLKEKNLPPPTHKNHESTFEEKNPC
jgi:hypothetical protein